MLNARNPRGKCGAVLPARKGIILAGRRLTLKGAPVAARKARARKHLHGLADSDADIMDDRTTEKTRPRTEAPRNAAIHPLDAWLRRELQAMYAGCAREPLPSGIAGLAARLEKALERQDRREHGLREQGGSGFPRAKP